MCVAGAGTRQPVLSAGGGKRGECASHAAARYAIHGDAVLWESSDDGLAAESGLCRQSEAGDPADAADGPAGAFAQEVTVSPPNVSSAEYAIRCGVILKTRIFNENPYV